MLVLVARCTFLCLSRLPSNNLGWYGGPTLKREYDETLVAIGRSQSGLYRIGIASSLYISSGVITVEQLQVFVYDIWFQTC